MRKRRRGGVMELRIDWGPGYRVYFARLGHVVILVLCGGDKKGVSQRKLYKKLIERADRLYKLHLEASAAETSD